MSEFTPGPWSQSHRLRADGMYSTEVYDVQGETIATIAWYPVPIPGGISTNRDANARLIAAAPDMHAYIVKRACVGDTEAMAILDAIAEGATS